MLRTHPARRWGSAGFALTLVLLGVAVGSLPESTRAVSSRTAEATFSDPAGDATNGAPDLTTIRVVDNASRTLTFSIPAAGLPAPEIRLDIYIDADRNRATGSFGADFWLILDGPNLARRTLRWDGARFVSWSPSTAQGGYQAGIWTQSINVSDLNGISSFDFYAASIRLRDDQIFGSDVTSYYSYTLPPPPPPPPPRKIAITGLAQAPAQPVAGKRFTVTAKVVRVGRGGRFNGDAFCDAQIGGRAVKSTGVAGSGQVSCRFEIPASAGGKRLTGSIGATEGGAEATRAFSARVAGPSARLSEVGVATAPPAGPRAGSQFIYALGVAVRHGSGAPARIQSGSVSCRATLGGRTLKVFEQRLRPFAGVRCGWVVPYGTSGATLNGVITVRSQGGTLRHVFKRRVR